MLELLLLLTNYLLLLLLNHKLLLLIDQWIGELETSDIRWHNARYVQQTQPCAYTPPQWLYT